MRRAGWLPGDTRLRELSQMKVAIAHYWFMARRGGERVVEVLAEMFPQADLYSLVVDRRTLPESLAKRSLTTSFVQKLPGSRRWHRQLLPLYPIALEQFDLRAYDLVLSSESGPAKGILTPTSTCHVCYCHSPMRYLWDLYPDYRDSAPKGSRRLFPLIAHYMRMWDLASASRVDYFVANSENVAARIQKHYRRTATVIYPPVDVRAGLLSERHDDYYLFVGELVSHKRADLAIEACNRLSRPLRVVGDGPEYKRLRRLCGPNVECVGYLCGEDLKEQYARCRALIFPSEDDLGMVPIEAQSFGRPVIAFGRGGALETVVGLSSGDTSSAAAATGIFFAEQIVEALVEAILAFEEAESSFSPEFIRSQVQRFDVSQFKTHMRTFLTEKVNEYEFKPHRKKGHQVA